MLHSDIACSYGKSLTYASLDMNLTFLQKMAFSVDTIGFSKFGLNLLKKIHFITPGTIVVKNFLRKKGPSLLEVKIQTGSINYLTRPKNLILVKNNFMKK